MRELLETKLKPALEAADEAAAATPEERVPAIDELIRRLSDAEAGVAELNKELEKTYEEMKKAEEMAEMADRQMALAEEAAKKDAMTPEERAAWEQKQAELEKELERRLAELEKKGDPLAEERKEAAKTADAMERLAELQKKLADLEQKLRDKESGARKEAEDELRNMTKEMAKDASAADRLEKLQEDVLDEARELQEKIAALQARLDALDNPDGKNPLDQAAQDAKRAQDEAQQALDAFQSNPDWDGQRDENAEQRQADGDPNAQRQWDGKKDPNAQEEQKDGQWDPNAKREWDGKIGHLPTQEREYVELRRQQQLKESQYLYLSQKGEESAIMLASQAVPAKVIDYPAQLPKVVSPKPLLLLIEWTLLMFVLASMGILFIDRKRLSV